MKCTGHCVDQRVGHFLPSHVLKHHHPREDNATGVDLILIRVLWRGPVGGFENRNTRVVVDVGAGCNTNSTHLGGQGVTDIITIQIHRGNHIKFRGSGQDLLEEDVGDAIFDENFVAGIALTIFPRNGHVRELLLHQLVTPPHEGPFGILHDVALVDQSHAFAAMFDRVVYGGPDQAFGAEFTHGLKTEA